MKKILWVIDNLGSGGAQRQMVTLAKMLKEKNYDISVVCYSKGDFFADVLAKEDIPVYWQIEDNYLKRVFAVRRFIRKGKYDVVISFMDVPNFLNCVAAIGGKKWKVITNELSAKQSTFTSKKGKIFAWFQRYSDALICNSHNAKNMWQKYYPQYKNRLGVIYNPVILPEIKSSYFPKIDGKLNIVIAASYQYLKNPIGVIKALLLLNKEQRNEIKINWYGRKEVTIGNSLAFDEASRLIKDNDLSECIKLHEETKDIIGIMYMADIVGLFSHVEGLPNAVLEGMMLGKPIIMTRISDFNQLVSNSNGFLCDADNPESIKNTFVKAIKLSQDQLSMMGRKSKDIAEHLFSPEVIVQEWMNKIEKD